MVEAYVAAGFVKIHLDASMGCAGEPAALAGRDRGRAGGGAGRGGRDGGRARRRPPPSTSSAPRCRSPGGALEVIEHLEPTAARGRAADLGRAPRGVRRGGSGRRRWSASSRMVVQPGVEFGHENVVIYDAGAGAGAERRPGPAAGAGVRGAFHRLPAGGEPARLVEDGFAILKVGPALTFALREALYGLDEIATALDPTGAEPSLAGAMEQADAGRPRLLAAPTIPGTPERAAGAAPLQLQRPHPLLLAGARGRGGGRAAAGPAGGDGRAGDAGQPVPADALPAGGRGALPARPRVLLLEAVRDVLRRYASACGRT